MSRRHTQGELAAAHRIFNRVNRLASSYYGADRTVDEVHKFISENRWIMFPNHTVDSLREGVEFPAPNVFVSFDKDITDNGSGQALGGWTGLTFNNTGAMAWINGIMADPKRFPFLQATINGLSAPWSVDVQQKIKTCHDKNTPKYRTMSEFDPHTVTIADIQGALSDSDANLLKRDDLYEDEPVIWDVTVMAIERRYTVATFDADIKSVFDLFLRVMALTGRSHLI